MTESKLNFALNEHDANLVLDALADRPYRQVCQLISEIQRQAQQQLLPPAADGGAAGEPAVAPTDESAPVEA